MDATREWQACIPLPYCFSASALIASNSSQRAYNFARFAFHKQNHGSAVIWSCSCSGRGQRQIT
jgi:hypothetical protein